MFNQVILRALGVLHGDNLHMLGHIQNDINNYKPCNDGYKINTYTYIVIYIIIYIYPFKDVTGTTPPSPK